jgi:hypothetical protein
MSAKGMMCRAALVFLVLGRLACPPTVRAEGTSPDRKPVVSAIPQGSEVTPPSPNACASKYDQFYRAEPGVYAYWALCESGPQSTDPRLYLAVRFRFRAHCACNGRCPRHSSVAILLITRNATVCFGGKFFAYQLFITNGGIDMAAAKALISSRAWTPVQVAMDYAPTFITPPVGGVYVSTQQLYRTFYIEPFIKTYSDMATRMPILHHRSAVPALATGLKAAKVTAVRYANGFGGIDADCEDWRGGNPCTLELGTKSNSQTVSTDNRLDTFCLSGCFSKPQ